MGGASRNEKRRKQAEAEARLAAAGIRPTPKKSTSRTPLIVVGVVVALAVAFGLGVFLNRDTGSSAAPTYSTTVSGAVVTAGSGPVMIDIYEDYLCPNCERFEARYGDDLTTALNENKVTVRYHAVAILDSRTNPPGYSTRAANAALCSAEVGIFPAYHKKLFDEQPAEGSAGLTDQQLIAFGTELGAPATFATCVTSQAHAADVAAETQAAATNPALQTDGGFGTPTVTVNGTKIDLNDSSWLERAIGS